MKPRDGCCDLEQVVGDHAVRRGERCGEIVDAVPLDALGKLGALCELGDSDLQLDSVDGLAAAQVAGHDLRLLDQACHADLARERTCRVVGQTLQRLGQSFGRSLQKRLEGGQDFQFVRKALCRGDLHNPLGDEPAELDEVGVRNCDHLAAAEDDDDVVTDGDDCRDARVVRPEHVRGLG